MHKGHLYSADTGASQNVGCNVIIYEIINYFSPCKNEADNDATQWFHEIFSWPTLLVNSGTKTSSVRYMLLDGRQNCIEKYGGANLLKEHLRHRYGKNVYVTTRMQLPSK